MVDRIAGSVSYASPALIVQRDAITQTSLAFQLQPTNQTSLTFQLQPTTPTSLALVATPTALTPGTQATSLGWLSKPGVNPLGLVADLRGRATHSSFPQDTTEAVATLALIATPMTVTSGTQTDVLSSISTSGVNPLGLTSDLVGRATPSSFGQNNTGAVQVEGPGSFRRPRGHRGADRIRQDAIDPVPLRSG